MTSSIILPPPLKLISPTGDVIDLIPAEIQRVIENPGFYIGSDPKHPDRGEVPLVSMGGKLYSMKRDAELDLTRYIPGHRIEGPFRAGPAVGTDEEEGV